MGFAVGDAVKATVGEEEEVTTPEQLIKIMAEMGETISLEEAQGMLQEAATAPESSEAVLQMPKGEVAFIRKQSSLAILRMPSNYELPLSEVSSYKIARQHKTTGKKNFVSSLAPIEEAASVAKKKTMGLQFAKRATNRLTFTNARQKWEAPPVWV
jgi:hypothetical protein